MNKEIKTMKAGKFLRYHRLTSGYKSQRYFAKKTGISSATISRVESNVQAPEAKTLKQLSQYLPSTTYGELMAAFGYESPEKLYNATKEIQLEVLNMVDGILKEAIEALDKGEKVNGLEYASKLIEQVNDSNVYVSEMPY